MLHFVGDINYTDGFFDTGFGIGSQIKKGLNPFKNIDFIIDDQYIGNFECVCSNNSNKQGIHRKQFIIEPEHLRNIHHFNIYNVANNHSMQHGEDAFRDTITNLNRFGASVFGSLNSKSICFEHKHYRVGMLSFSFRHENFCSNPQYWYLPNYKDIAEEFDRIKKCDLRVAYIHWGNEFINYPYSDQKFIAHSLVDLGFNLVIGLHSHILQGFEIYNGKHIFYSIGNFLFNMPTAETHYSAMIDVDLDDSKNIKVNYSYIKLDENGFPNTIEPKKVPDNIRFEYLNRYLEKETENEKYYLQLQKSIKRYRVKNILTIISWLPKYRIAELFGILKDYINRRLK
jgi:poly-gamma-glutamate capsule biosynthesis protein CapA/YwtB (metallophosphatase superfamily)